MKEKKAVVAVSFGTSHADTREATIGAIENALREAFPGRDVVRAFTSKIVIEIMKKRDGLNIDGIEEALSRLAALKYTEVTVQPTHLMGGIEYDGLMETVRRFAPRFERLAAGDPLLASPRDMALVADAAAGDVAAYDDGNTAIALMGHGSDHAANAVYEQLEAVFRERGHANFFIGTVEAKPDVCDVIAAVKNGGFKKALLQPLMVVAGDHAKNDMAGDGGDSWKSMFEKSGIETKCILRGLGSIGAVQDIYVSHAKNARPII